MATGDPTSHMIGDEEVGKYMEVRTCLNEGTRKVRCVRPREGGRGYSLQLKLFLLH